MIKERSSIQQVIDKLREALANLDRKGKTLAAAHLSQAIAILEAELDEGEPPLGS